jgi:hypothetical protein
MQDIDSIRLHPNTWEVHKRGPMQQSSCLRIPDAPEKANVGPSSSNRQHRILFKVGHVTEQPGRVEAVSRHQKLSPTEGNLTSDTPPEKTLFSVVIFQTTPILPNDLPHVIVVPYRDDDGTILDELSVLSCRESFTRAAV